MGMMIGFFPLHSFIEVRVNRPITHRLPMTEHLGRSFSQFFSIFSDLKCYIGAPSQALQIIFEMQSQKTSQNTSSKENTFF
jgi:hypothetical protein